MFATIFCDVQNTEKHNMYTHRLKNTTSKNAVKDAELKESCPLFFHAMYIMIFISISSIILGLIIFCLWNVGQISMTDENYQKYSQIITSVAVIAASLDILIHFMIIRQYIKGLFAMSRFYFSKKFWEIYKANNDKIHEQMMEASRYTVLFGGYIMILFVLGIIGLGIQLGRLNPDYDDKLGFYGYDAVIAYLLIRDMLSLIAMFLSFKFSHKWYEKKYLCGYCDEKMKQYWVNMAKEIDGNMNDYADQECQCGGFCMKSLIVDEEYSIKDEKRERLLQCNDYEEEYGTKDSRQRPIIQNNLYRDSDL